MVSSPKELVSSLSDALRERCRFLGKATEFRPAEFVLYWMRTAMRSDENQALQVTIHCANQLALPVLVYQGLTERYPYASDRHHWFVLQGVRDVQTGMDKLGISYAFHLERPGHRGPVLRQLTERAALTVTEDFPVAPICRWTTQLARRSRTPVLAVDTACVVPMCLVGQAYDRAFAFREATKALAFSRRGHKLPDTAVDHTLPAKLPLPFAPVDCRQTELAALVAACDIDHTVGPVPGSPGGSVAGYRRWDEFRERRLMNYARDRNDPLADGASRMSPYLHYGMVSPQRIAREALQVQGDGSSKFLDELLVWRELAYAFCFYRDDHARLSAIPSWARETLSKHEQDPRPALWSWERMARSRTDDELWNAAQTSLRIHGELHNNVRMTWGKAIAFWTSTTQSAWQRLTDLNHRYALDGRDPASFGGLLWCLGQFDRPFKPEQPIFGSVRVRPTEQHASRIDVGGYLRHVQRPLAKKMPTIAVVGAGLAGLMCARTLSDHGLHVQVFEKSRGVSGRMATRRSPQGIRFDHGAQYFTVRDPKFRRYVDSWRADRIVQRWAGKIVTLTQGQAVDEKHAVERFVGVPGMSAIGKHLAEELNVRLRTQVDSLRREQERWRLTSVDGASLGHFDWVIVATPAAQASRLLQPVPSLAARIAQAHMAGCWAMLASFPQSIHLEFDGAFVRESPLRWIARDNSKPERSADGADNWVFHATPEWSAKHLDEDTAQVEMQLLQAFWQVVARPPASTSFQTAHRWRFALPTRPLEEKCLDEPSHQVVVCGDWCGGSRVEAAFLSGSAAAGRILGTLGRSSELLGDDPGNPGVEAPGGA